MITTSENRTLENGDMLKVISTTLQIETEVPDDVDLDTHAGHEAALMLVAQDVSTRSKSEIKNIVVDIEYGEQL